MTDTIKPFREAVENTELWKQMQEVGYGSITITFDKGKLRDIIPAPAYRTPEVVHYDMSKTSMSK